MAYFVDVKDEAFELFDSELIELRNAIDIEIQRRKREKDREATAKVVKAIQDYIAAGYTLNICGSVCYYADGYEHTADVMTEVSTIESDTDEITLRFDETYIEL